MTAPEPERAELEVTWRPIPRRWWRRLARFVRRVLGKTKPLEPGVYETFVEAHAAARWLIDQVHPYRSDVAVRMNVEGVDVVGEVPPGIWNMNQITLYPGGRLTLRVKGGHDAGRVEFRKDRA